MSMFPGFELVASWLVFKGVCLVREACIKVWGHKQGYTLLLYSSMRLCGWEF